MKRKKLILRSLLGAVLLIICAVVLIVFNVSNQYKKMMKGEMISLQETDTIPFTYSSSGHIVIQAKLPGLEQEQSFILDCGASNMLFKGHCNGIEFKNNGFGFGIGAGGNFFTTKIKEIESIQIGSYKFKEINFKETDFNIGCSDEICGLIGTGIMHNLDWQIDFEKQEIIVSTNKDNFTYGENIISVPLSLNKHSAHISASFQFRKNKKRHFVLVDLGNNGTLNLKESMILNDSLDFQFKQRIGLQSNALGDEDKKASQEKVYLADTIWFDKGNYTVNNVPINTSPNGLNLLGLGFFEKYKTTISWKSKLLLLEPYEQSQNFIWNTYGFWLKFDDEIGKTIIETLIENTPASTANVPLNAEVISINDFIFDSKEALCNYKSSEDRDKQIQLTVINNGKTEKYDLQKVRVF
jgi:hypothetical protein